MSIFFIQGTLYKKIYQYLHFATLTRTLENGQSHIEQGPWTSVLLLNIHWQTRLLRVTDVTICKHPDHEALWSWSMKHFYHEAKILKIIKAETSRVRKRWFLRFRRTKFCSQILCKICQVFRQSSKSALLFPFIKGNIF